MPRFQENLVSVGPMCDANYTVTLPKHAHNIYSTTGTPIITGWRETDGPRLWRMSLLPNPEYLPPLFSDPDAHKTSLQDVSTYDLPSVEALVWYLHADSGFPVHDTWLKSIKEVNFASWLGLAYQNSANSFPVSDNTLKGHVVKLHQGIRYTKPNPQRINCNITEATSLPRDTTPSHELHIKIEHIRKMYPDDTGRFPVRSRSGNKYIMIAYNFDSNATIAAPFKTRSRKHIPLAYGASMQRIKYRNILVDL